MMSQPITLSDEEPIARITLDRPEAQNSLNWEMLKELSDAVTTLETWPDVRCVILQAAGPAFCAGADLSVVKDASPDELKQFLKNATETFRTIETAPFPVVCAVDGAATGGGMELVLASDIAVASTDTRFALPEATLGLLPAGGGTQRLPRLVGKKMAGELLYTGRFLSPARAKELGILNEVTDGSAVDVAQEYAEDIAKAAPLAVEACKRLVLGQHRQDFVSGLEAEQEEAYNLIETDDSAEGIRAFLEKREPTFERE